MKSDYKVLSNRLRPQFFRDVIGQNVFITIFKNSILMKRIPSTYLLYGKHGIGKTTIARILAKYFNCQNKKENDYEPCGKCISCKAIATNSSHDVVEIDAASNTGVDDVREIIEQANYSPQGNYKIFIIDEVHMFSKSAFNALLKILEEAPSHIKFIFATTDISSVPLTVLSRCQVHRLTAISQADLMKYLQQVLKNEKIKFENSAIESFLINFEGSVRDVLSNLEALICFSQGEITFESVNLFLRFPSIDFTQKLLLLIISEDFRKISQEIDQINSNQDFKVLIKNLYKMFSDLIFILLTKEFSELYFEKEFYENLLQKYEKSCSIKNLRECLNVLEKNLRDLSKIELKKVIFDCALCFISGGGGADSNSR